MLKGQGISPARNFKLEPHVRQHSNIQSSGKLTMEALLNAIYATPIIDNHAHGLLKCEAQYKHRLLSITTEATGEALKSATSTLSHIRAVKQLAGVLGCRDNWDDVVDTIRTKKNEDEDAWTRRCLEGIQTILMDDYYHVGTNDVHEYLWHNTFTKTTCKRIVRIETVAEDIMEVLRQGIQSYLHEDLWQKFMDSFTKMINGFLGYDEIVAFKSVISYRTGLGIPTAVNGEDAATACRGIFRRLMHCTIQEYQKLTKVDGTILNAYLVHQVAKLISASPKVYKHPIQFHTGLGDQDIDLAKSRPSQMQDFIKAWPQVPIVLLHGSYPWTKEAGFLASMYHNVYADIGEVFPKVSKEGQENVLREILELCPTDKILCSTNGYWFPENYLLATTQIREGLEEVLSDYVRTGALTISQAITLTQNILFQNSNKLYDLGLPMVNLTHTSRKRQRSVSPTKSVSPIRISRPLTQGPPRNIAATRDLSIRASRSVFQSQIRSTRSPTRSRPQTPVTSELTPETPEEQTSWTPQSFNSPSPDSKLLLDFLQDHPDIKYLRLQYLDYTSSLRLRVIPLTRAIQLSEADTPLTVNIASAALSVLQNDTCPPEAGAAAVGQLKLKAAFESLRTGPSPSYASVQCEFKKNDLADVELCPRSVCRRAIERAHSKNLEFLLGFEIEVVFFSFDESTEKYTVSPGFGRSRSWGSSRGFNYPLPLKLVNDIFDALAVAGIHLEYFHSESADGQYEFVLPPLAPLKAVDTLVQARQIIVTIAQTHNLRATLFPKPFPMQAGTAAHVHISIVPSEEQKENPENYHAFLVQQYRSFYAGILKHLGSILAFSYSQSASYDRMADTCWAGGTWVCWGTENREAPLRKIEGSHWEIKVLDGLANPYFAIAAIITAGTQGVVDKEKLNIGDCPVDPGSLSEHDRRKLGIVNKLPKDLNASLTSLERNQQLKELLGIAFVERYLIVKRAEAKMLEEMSAEERREWIIERY